MEKIWSGNYWLIRCYTCNLFLPTMLMIFQNVENIIIYHNCTNRSYSISMIYLLSLIESTKVNKVLIEARNQNESQELRKEYMNKSYDIKI